MIALAGCAHVTTLLLGKFIIMLCFWFTIYHIGYLIKVRINNYNNDLVVFL